VEDSQAQPRHPNWNNLRQLEDIQIGAPIPGHNSPPDLGLIALKVGTCRDFPEPTGRLELPTPSLRVAHLQDNCDDCGQMTPCQCS
jgi:hypothetical protein